MAMTGSFLTDAEANVRLYTDEPKYDKKYTSDIIIDMIERSYAHVLSDLNKLATSPAVARYTLTFVSETFVYPLPFTIGQVYAIYTQEPNGGYKVFYRSAGRTNPWGRGVWIENNMFHVQNNYVIGAGTEIIVEYIPQGLARLHNGTIVRTDVDSTDKVITLDTTPDTGVIDNRPHAYVGSVFRVISDDQAGLTYNIGQERTISAHDVAAGTITLSSALSPSLYEVGHTGTTSYEIGPVIQRGLDHVIALYVAQWILKMEGDARKKDIEKLYVDARRTVRLNTFYSVIDEALQPKSDGQHRRHMLRGFRGYA